MRWLAWCLTGAAALLLGCSEPGKQVMGATADGRFSLSLQAAKNWVRPGETLPILVRIQPLYGPPAEGLTDTLRLVANNGSLYPQRLPVAFAAAEDSLGAGAQTAFVTWVYFTAATRLSDGVQGEAHALFLDALATLRIRIVPSPDSL
jgi:hypothetical protein